MKALRLPLMLMGLLLSPACAARDVAPAPAAPAAAEANPALWVLKDADTTIYMFGTVHVLKPGTQWMSPTVEKAFDSADELLLEIVEPEGADMAKEVGAVAIRLDGPPLTQLLGPKDGPRYIAAMEQAKLPWQAYERFKPWMAGVTLSVAPLGALGYAEDAGVEKVLTQRAQAKGKSIAALETVAQQLGYFDGLAMPEQLAFVSATLDGLPTVEKDFGELVESWRSGRPEALADQMNDTLKATPGLAKALLFDRNTRWAQQLKARLEKPGVVFMAVGAGHLAGTGSVQEQLEKIGLKTQRVATPRP